MDYKQFSTIIFDLGGVFINLDYQKTIDAFTKLTGKDFNDVFSQKKQFHLFDDLETGEISPSEFRHKLRRAFEFEATDKDIDSAWNAMLLDIPKHRFEILEKIKERGTNVILLSNTNEIHKKAFDVDFKNSISNMSLESHFNKAYLSFLIGDRKPNKSIFERVLRENNLNAKDTLYIEDSIQHIEAAKSLGIQCIHHPTNACISLYDLA